MSNQFNTEGMANSNSIDQIAYQPSPKINSNNFQRSKYYSAIKTGMKHMNPTEMRNSFLARPKA